MHILKLLLNGFVFLNVLTTLGTTELMSKLQEIAFPNKKMTKASTLVTCVPASSL